jgi:hypothetical protein
MREFNLENLDCETLRRRRRSVDINIADDQSRRDSLNAQIRRVEILKADKEFELEQVGQPPLPGLPSPNRRRPGKRPKPGAFGVAITAADLADSRAENAIERRRLWSEIREYDATLQGLRQARFERQERLNELIAGRALITEALDRKRC